MNLERLNAIKQQLAALSADEKLDLAEFLKEQAQKDNEVEATATQTNGYEETPDPYRRREMEWLKQHDQEYAGQYVAVLGDRLVAHADTLPELDRLIKASGVRRPVITRIKAPGEVLFGGW
jgi:hypothetical protein